MAKQTLRDEKREQTRINLLAAGLELLNLPIMTVRDLTSGRVSRQINLSTGAFYHNWDTELEYRLAVLGMTGTELVVVSSHSNWQIVANGPVAYRLAKFIAAATPGTRYSEPVRRIMAQVQTAGGLSDAQAQQFWGILAQRLVNGK